MRALHETGNPWRAVLSRSRRPSGLPLPLKLVGAHVDVAEDTPQRPDLQGSLPVHGHRGVLAAAGEEVVAAVDAGECEALVLEEAEHLLTGGPRPLTHA